MATVRFAVQATGQGPIINSVLLDDGAGNVIERHVTAGGGEHRLFLPLIWLPMLPPRPKPAIIAP